MLLRQAIEDVARCVNLTAPAGNVRAEDAPYRLAQGFRAVDDEEMATFGVEEAALDQVVEKGLHGSNVLYRALDDARRMLSPACFDACGPEHRHPVLVAHVRPSIRIATWSRCERPEDIRSSCRIRVRASSVWRRPTSIAPRPGSIGIPASGSRMILSN